MCSRLSNPYNVASGARCIISVHGYLTLIISTALLVSSACCSSLSLFCNGHCMCSRLSNPYNVASGARCIISVHGYLTLIISTALLPAFALCFSLLLLSVGHGRVFHIMGYDGWKVIIVGIHSQPCSEYIFIALGINIYLALGIMTCLAIGLWVRKLDSNCCSFLLSPTAPTPRTKVIGESVARFAQPFESSFLLSPTAPTPRTKVIGESVARFAQPFESRPADPVRREVFRQLAAHPDTASTSGWVTPSSFLPATPPPLQKGSEESSSRPVPPKAKGKRRLAF